MRWGSSADLQTPSTPTPRDALVSAPAHRLWLGPPGAGPALTPRPGQVGGSSQQSSCCKVGPRSPFSAPAVWAAREGWAPPSSLCCKVEQLPRAPFFLLSRLHQPGT